MYQGLQKLLDISSDEIVQKSESKQDSKHHSSRTSRPVSKLVRHVALGEEIDLDGIYVIITL